MTQDEARDLFSSAYDGELSSEDRERFEALLAEDEELRQEFGEFQEMLGQAQALAEGEGGEPDVDLMAGVQSKLRVRSRGRYYRDRFARRTGAQAMMPILLAAVMLMLLLVAWFVLHFAQVEEDRGASPPPPADTRPV